MGRLISLSTLVQQARRDTLYWLRVEFGVQKPGQTLEDFAALDADTFVEEVRKRRPKSAGRLTPGALRDLRSGYEEGAAPVREAGAEATRLERRLSDLVNRAYGLTPEELNLLWTTAPNAALLTWSQRISRLAGGALAVPRQVYWPARARDVGGSWRDCAAVSKRRGGRYRYLYSGWEDARSSQLVWRGTRCSARSPPI